VSSVLCCYFVSGGHLHTVKCTNRSELSVGDGEVSGASDVDDTTIGIGPEPRGKCILPVFLEQNRIYNDHGYT
jgi:hypothetical protein